MKLLFLLDETAKGIFLELLVACTVTAGITVWRIHKIPGMRGMRGGNTTGNKHRVRNIMLGVEFFRDISYPLCDTEQ